MFYYTRRGIPFWSFLQTLAEDLNPFKTLPFQAKISMIFNIFGSEISTPIYSSSPYFLNQIQNQPSVKLVHFNLWTFIIPWIRKK